jgi:hypothetical protein
VSLVAAAFCPHPPLLVPSIAAGAAHELDNLRTACATALERVYAARPDAIIIVGGGTETREHGPHDFGSFDPYGVRETYPLGGRDSLAVGVRLPLSLAIGAWLLRDHPAGPPRRGLSIASTASPSECAVQGHDIALRADRVGLIVMGDGSACRGDKSPGYADPRAEAFDASVTKALANADTGALLAIDVDTAAELLVAGVAAWQVLAGAATGRFRGGVAYDAAPYGVQYTVASWEPA